MATVPPNGPEAIKLSGKPINLSEIRNPGRRQFPVATATEFFSCTLEQCTRIMHFKPDYQYAPPPNPSFSPCYGEQCSDNPLPESISMYAAGAYRHGLLQAAPKCVPFWHISQTPGSDIPVTSGMAAVNVLVGPRIGPTVTKNGGKLARRSRGWTYAYTRPANSDRRTQFDRHRRAGDAPGAGPRPGAPNPS